MKTVAIIQARLGSSRLPGKVLRHIGERTMIERVVERLQRCQTIDQVVIATTTEPADQRLVEFCQQRHWTVYTGSEHDVLTRYVEAANAFRADRIVRITSDCPLIEPTLVDRTVKLLSNAPGIDYACNFHPHRRFPRGLDCEVLTRDALERLDTLATEIRHREHATLYVYQNPSQFTIASINCENDWSRLRWTVDTEEDLQLANAIYEHFGGSDFDWKQVIAAYSNHPNWLEINRHCIQKVA
jgi:spore coat polysaccharide biosynthesis protein SpsF